MFLATIADGKTTASWGEGKESSKNSPRVRFWMGPFSEQSSEQPLSGEPLVHMTFQGIPNSSNVPPKMVLVHGWLFPLGNKISTQIFGVIFSNWGGPAHQKYLETLHNIQVFSGTPRDTERAFCCA